MLRPSTSPVTSSIRSASVDLPWSMWAMMQKFRMRAGSVVAGVVTVPPSSHAPAGGTAARPGDRRGRHGDAEPVLERDGDQRPRRRPSAGSASRPVVSRRLRARSRWSSRRPRSSAAIWSPRRGGPRGPSERPPVDLGWYGGVPVASYSLLGPWAGALLGLPLVGIARDGRWAPPATTALLGRLAPAPRALDRRRRGRGGDVGGRRVERPDDVRGWARRSGASRSSWPVGGPGVRRRLVGARSWRRWPARSSPLASAFLLVAAAAWWCGTQPRPSPDCARARSEPWWIAGGALLPLVAARLLGAVSGPQPSSAHQMIAAVAATGLTARPRAGRGTGCCAPGSAWTAVLLLATWLISDPVGSNSDAPGPALRRPGAGRGGTHGAVGGHRCSRALAVGWLLPPVLVGRPRCRGTRPLRRARRRAAAPNSSDRRPGGAGRGGAASTATRRACGWPGACRWPADGCASSTRLAARSSTTASLGRRRVPAAG